MPGPAPASSSRCTGRSSTPRVRPALRAFSSPTSGRASARIRPGCPRCDCGRPLKPDVVLFGEYLPEPALLRAQALVAQADLLLCIGSSLEVYPVGQLPAVTLAGGGRLAIVTQGRTPYDADAAVRAGGDVVDELRAVVELLGIA